MLELVMLGAIWGASFLFMRIAVPGFGPLALIDLRVAIAALVLGVVLVARGHGLGQLRAVAGPLVVLGAINSALPFSLFAYATISLTAGFASILNATVPFFGVLIAAFWFREPVARHRLLGIAVGFAGVVILVWGDLIVGGDIKAVAAGLLSGLLYAIAAHYSKRKLAGVDPLVIATGSQIAAAVLLLPLAIWFRPTVMPTSTSWLAVAALGVVCTGAAYVLYFRLIASVGPSRAVIVTYLIPVFGLLWGFAFLDERVTVAVLAGCAVILAGVMMVNWSPRVA
jgi:drug/metabolite transporter (DMT)-like permease